MRRIRELRSCFRMLKNSVTEFREPDLSFGIPEEMARRLTID